LARALEILRLDPIKLTALLDDLSGPGWHIDTAFLTEPQVQALREECLAGLDAGDFHPAGVGSGQAQVHNEIRGDQIFWIDENTAGPALGAVLQRLEALRLAVNQTLFLGLFDLEVHFAAYPPGAGYQRHLDRFRDDDRRSLTLILYLNPADWSVADGGQLHFWPDEKTPPLEIEPAGGTLVVFLSDRFWHQVLPAQRQRLSLTGWYRRR